MQANEIFQTAKDTLKQKLVAEWNDKIKRVEDEREGKYVPDVSDRMVSDMSFQCGDSSPFALLVGYS